jgi:hypothetical protein
VSKRLLVVVVVVVVSATVTCGGGSPSPASAADAAVQQADLPAGLVKCDGSGPIDIFLASIQGTDEVSYRLISEGWDAAKQDGADGAEVVLFSDSAGDCESVHHQPSGQIGAVSGPLVISIAIRFRNEASAALAYGRDSIMGFSRQVLQESPGVVEGKSTGLGRNSIVAAVSSVYAAMWQNRTFLLRLVTVNVDPDASKRIATHQQARVGKLSTVSRPLASSPRSEVKSASGAVGEPIDVDEATVTLVTADLNAQPSSGQAGPEAGNRFVRVTITVVYKKTSTGGFRTTLKDSSGTTYESGPSTTTYPSFPTHPGDEATGDLWFQVPEGASGLSVTVAVDPDTVTVSLG